ncbi:MAG TPA: cytochrome c1 [Geminicoccus sp.]|jgi:ubiquinol-cytochrome c reductase cytochrome c1 subunit|uniref:cytochrome c1 n=1 Tax=Geminicoccus sp. TaxID=2024832 RepID=UPI002E314C3E|nr:cytochrome c1 [Geminicoccus sp.]HEX2529750.1 cytochrome c1 [Geminicoccus sp.]
MTFVKLSAALVAGLLWTGMAVAQENVPANDQEKKTLEGTADKGGEAGSGQQTEMTGAAPASPPGAEHTADVNQELEIRHDTVELKEEDWPHAGVFGTYDRAALQRGFKVYEEVCHGCHAAKYLTFRSLADIGFNEDEVKAIAAKYEVQDGPDDAGDMFQRPARASDRMPAPFPNDNAARAANGGALPPDLSLMAKARQDGDNYLYSLLTGYADPPPGEEVAEGQYYNTYFPGHKIGMPPPLSPDQVTYDDGTTASVDQMSRDVTQFLSWLAEPKMEERKQTGIKVMLFLLILSVLLYFYMRKVWSDVH